MREAVKQVARFGIFGNFLVSVPVWYFGGAMLIKKVRLLQDF